MKAYRKLFTKQNKLSTSTKASFIASRSNKINIKFAICLPKNLYHIGKYYYNLYRLPPRQALLRKQVHGVNLYWHGGVTVSSVDWRYGWDTKKAITCVCVPLVHRGTLHYRDTSRSQTEARLQRFVFLVFYGFSAVWPSE